MRIHHFVFFCLSLALALPGAANPPGGDDAPLSFAERVACQEKIEDVYWAHRIWPPSNPGPKPAREEVLSHSQIVSRVEKQLLMESALVHYWGESLGAKRVQAELDRIARSTRDPRLLIDVFSALDNDPRLIAECYVRPRTAERLVRERYAWDPGIHGELKRKAEAMLLEAPTLESLKSSGVRITETTFVRQGTPDLATAADAMPLSPEDWETALHQLAGLVPSSLSDPMERVTQRAGLGFSPLREEMGAFVSVRVLEADLDHLRIVSATWTKPSFEKWLHEAAYEVAPSPQPAGSYTVPKLKTSGPCIDDTWQPTSSGSPSARTSHSGVWTGSEYVIWGGSTVSGSLNTGGRYDPASDTWMEIDTSGAPPGRAQALTVWTGSEMIVWGGRDGDDYPTSGGRYNPTTDTWTPTSMSNVPVGRYHTTAVWTGTEMFFWGGWNPAVYLSLPNNGGRYNPVTDAWTAPSTSGSPGYRQLHITEWTGSEVVVWGGWYGSAMNSGNLYDPATDSWSTMTTSGAPSARYYTDGVWSGSEVLVWGGWNGSSTLDTGGRYDPSGNSWSAITTTSAPQAVYVHGVVWADDEMIVWGGSDGSDYVNTGGRYDPVAGTWAATSLDGALSARAGHSMVWSGSEVIAWAGSTASGVNTETGGRYCASGLLGIDFGDAADPTYPTLLSSDGARHQLWGELHLGASVDAEGDGHPGPGAQGDDNDGVDDEDGVIKPAYFYAGTSTAITVTASAAGYLNVWIDHQKDGDWYDAGEQVLTDFPVSAGDNTAQIFLPLDASTGATAMRVRLNSTGGLSPTGLASDGEVEDYTLSIEPTAELQVLITDDPDPVVEGEQLVYTLDLVNNGQATATNVTLSATLADELSLLSSTPVSPICTEASGVVSCDLASLGGGSSTQVEFVTEVQQGFSGTVTLEATVGLDESDPVPGNNSDSEDTLVNRSPLVFEDDFESGDLQWWTVP